MHKNDIKMYKEEDYLQLSGIQHFAFCRRQWALIYIENMWTENVYTIEGHIFHESAHGGKLSEKRKGLIISRGMPVSSSKLGITGICDVVEFHEVDNGITLHGRRGKYKPVIIEYKKGRPKKHNADRLQLCAQAMCLEEMLACTINEGYMFYGEIKHREDVIFTSELKNEVCSIVEEMHMLMQRKHTPRVKTGNKCKSCSLANLCLPVLNENKSVSRYISNMLKK
ncbi:MAG: CRISPR-associated protein Cas4 [Clostridia bacterium]|jgi:CRISPR-associated exonuclease Cas4